MAAHFRRHLIRPPAGGRFFRPSPFDLPPGRGKVAAEPPDEGATFRSRHSEALFSRHSEAEGRRIRTPFPWVFGKDGEIRILRSAQNDAGVENGGRAGGCYPPLQKTPRAWGRGGYQPPAAPPFSPVILSRRRRIRLFHPSTRQNAMGQKRFGAPSRRAPRQTSRVRRYSSSLRRCSMALRSMREICTWLTPRTLAVLSWVRFL